MLHGQQSFEQSMCCFEANENYIKFTAVAGVYNVTAVICKKYTFLLADEYFYPLS